MNIGQFFVDPNFKIEPTISEDSVSFINNIKTALDEESLIKNYLLSTRIFERKNESKAKFVLLATIFLVLSVSFTAVAIVMVFLSYSPMPTEANFTCSKLDIPPTKPSLIAV